MSIKFNFEFKDALKSKPIRSNSDRKSDPKSELTLSEKFKPILTNKCSNDMNDENVRQNEANSCDESKRFESRVAEELVKIETFKAMTETKLENQHKRIEELKTSIEDKKRKCIELENEKAILKHSLSARKAERNAVSNGIEKTRQMLMKSKRFADCVNSRLAHIENMKPIIEDVGNESKQSRHEMRQTFATIERKCRKKLENESRKLNERMAEVSSLEQMANKKEIEFANCEIESNKLMASKQNQVMDAMKERNDLEKCCVQLDSDLAVQESDITAVDKSCRDLMQEIADDELKYKLFAENAKQKEEEYSTFENDFEKQIKDLRTKLDLLSNEKNSSEMRVKDLESNIENMKLQITDLKADNETVIIDKQSNIEELMNRKQSLESEVESMRKEFDSRVEDMKRSLENANIKIEELNESKTKRESSILVVKASISECEVNSNHLRDENEKLQTEVNQIENKLDLSRKESDSEIKRLTESANSITAEIELLKQEKQNFEQQLERDKHSHEIQISKLTQILDSCKMDYNKRIEDKESHLKRVKDELENVKISITHVRNQNEALETEKSKITVKLQELTFDTLRSTRSSRVILTPKQMSPIESGRSDASTSTVSLPMNMDFISSLKSSLSKKQSNNDQELMANKKPKSSSDPKTGHSKADPKANPKSGEIAKTDDDSDETVLDMDDTAVVEKIRAIKTYSRRAENIIEGRPTPSKDNDLSWLNFD